MQKAHDASKNNYWRNYPNVSTPIVQDELNRNETTVDIIDDRVITLDSTKANQTDLLQSMKTVSYAPSTGTFTFTLWNGSTIIVDTDIEKIAVNFDYDDDPTSAHYQNLIITLEDGTKKYIDLSALITEYEFTDSGTIAFTVAQDGSVSAIVKDGSITEAKLEPNFLALVRIEVSKAQGYSETSEAWAVGKRNGSDVPPTDETYHNNAKYYSEQADALGQAQAENSEAWAVGQRGGTDVPSTDVTYQNNSKYYSNQASQSATTASNAAIDAQGILEEIEQKVGETVFTVNFATGELEYTAPGITFDINTTTGNLEWEVVA